MVGYKSDSAFLLLDPVAIIVYIKILCAGVAQLVEQLTCNQQVAGSSPIASSTKRFFAGSSSGGIPEWPKGTDCKSVVGRLRRFESSSLHHKMLQSLQLRHSPRRPPVDRTGVGLAVAISKNLIRVELAGVAQLARASAFQAEGRGFESRFPLQFSTMPT